MTKRIWMWLAGIVLFESVSFAVVFFPSVNTVVAILLAAALAVLSYFRPTLGLSVLAVEMMIGSKGALFNAYGDAQNNGGLSIRILFFAAFLLGWFVWALVRRTYKDWPSYLTGRKIYLLIAVIVLYACINGWLRNPHGNVLSDANAWGFWLLILPVLDLVRHRKDALAADLSPAVTASLIWLPVKSLILFYLFSHNYPQSLLDTVYLWVRRTGVGEITRVVGHTYRIFLQSQIYAVLALAAGLVLIKKSDDKSAVLGKAILVLSVSEVIIGLSRSFWIGSAACVFVAVTYILRRKIKRLLSWFIQWGVIGIASVVLILVALLFPIPRSEGSFLSMLQARADIGESAVVSRWQLLPVLWQGISSHAVLGSGFGATVTYASQDPRVLALTGGSYTTFAFEWGWLDFCYKFGLFGALVILALLVHLARTVWRSDMTPDQRWAVLSALIALAVTHFFTPYLNHPLGFSFLIAAEGYAAARQRMSA